jgi:uncharacterized circularly permuted ATP-grasp superfamily protein/uncharacterized alpha-E superfamily protein
MAVPDSSAVSLPGPAPAPGGRAVTGAAAQRPFTADRSRAVAAGLGSLGEDDLRRADLHARQRLGSSVGGPGLWGTLDPLPVSIDPETWAFVTAGVRQRVELLDRVAADVYGAQALVAGRLLPADLLWCNPQMVRPAVGHRPPSGRWLVHAAVDLAFLEDGMPDAATAGLPSGGRVVVVGVDTATLAGLGHAHENRLATAELLPGLFTRARVERFVPFLDRLRSRLAQLRTAGADEPVRVTILSSSRRGRSPGWAGHADAAHLARTLGYTLVEGPDLTVRGGQVYLKSLSGLEAVHVVLRLLPDGLCDPLDLDAASHEGTPSLLTAALRGRVALANPVGAGWLANPALEAFLPALCRALLGEDLRVPGPPSWWCGEPEGRRRALDHLHDLVLMGIDGATVLDTRRLGSDDLALARARLEAEPRQWVAVEPVEPRAVPTYVEGRLQRLPTVTRTFAVLEEDGIVVAPGGLTRVLGGERSVGHHPQPPPGHLTVTKDTWVLADGRERPAPRRRPAGLEQVDFADSLPSRAGESLYWLGRYAERAEAIVRLAGVLAAPTRELDEEPPWVSRLIVAMEALTDGRAAVARPSGGARAAATAALTDPDRPAGLRATIGNLVASAAAVSDLVSPELEQAVRDAADAAGGLEPAGAVDAGETLDRLLGALAAVAGLAQETMVRGPGWLLLDAGRRVERALALLRVLRATLVAPTPHHVPAELLEAVLAQSASLIAYRRRYRSDPELGAVVGLLLLDAANPRSLRFQVDALAHDLAHLPEGGRRTRRHRVTGGARRLADELHVADAGALARPGPAGAADALAGLLERAADELRRLARAIDLEYLAQVEAATLPTGTVAIPAEETAPAEGTGLPPSPAPPPGTA